MPIGQSTFVRLGMAADRRWFQNGGLIAGDKASHTVNLRSATNSMRQGTSSCWLSNFCSPWQWYVSGILDRVPEYHKSISQPAAVQQT